MLHEPEELIPQPIAESRWAEAMEWAKLISTKRFKEPATEGQRTPFQRDADRIVFSAAFRRLQDKTQVHPFPDSDYIRRRLTHSLEVSCVGRSLGAAVGHYLGQHDNSLKSKKQTLPFTLRQIAANACLAHDIVTLLSGMPAKEQLGHGSAKGSPALSERNLAKRSRQTCIPPRKLHS
jgi:dGTPase